MGSSILRCFSSYYGLIMWLISTRWPQRDKRPQGLDLLKLSLSGWFFFSSSPIYLYGSAQKHRRRFLGACTMRRTPAHFCLIWVRESELLNICGNFVVCARACACILTKWRNRARAQADGASLAFGGSLHTWFIPCYPPTLLFMTYFSFETRFITWITWRSFPGPIFFTNSRI